MRPIMRVKSRKVCEHDPPNVEICAIHAPNIENLIEQMFAVPKGIRFARGHASRFTEDFWRNTMLNLHARKA